MKKEIIKSIKITWKGELMWNRRYTRPISILERKVKITKLVKKENDWNKKERMKEITEP